MRHLFIVNPAAEKNRNKNDKIIRELRMFLQNYSDFNYMIHITRWRRDAYGYARRYVQRAAGETVRIHVIGGTGTLFEVVNGVFGLPNVQIAVYPRGRDNTFLHNYGIEKFNMYNDFSKQVFGKTIKIDVMRCNTNYVMCYMLIGFEADAITKGEELSKKTRINPELSYNLMVTFDFLRKSFNKQYKISLGNQEMDGKYAAISAAIRPKHVKNKVADNGLFSIYGINSIKANLEAIKAIFAYSSGDRKKYTDKNFYLTGNKLSIESKHPVCTILDGELFYYNNIDFEILPNAIDFVCPDSIIAYNSIHTSGKEWEYSNLHFN